MLRPSCMALVAGHASAMPLFLFLLPKHISEPRRHRQGRSSSPTRLRPAPWPEPPERVAPGTAGPLRGAEMSKHGGPDWNGLLKWSLAHGDDTNPPHALSEEDKRWFMEAMQANTIDVVKRMKEITQVMKTPEDVLQSQGVTLENIEGSTDFVSAMKD